MHRLKYKIIESPVGDLKIVTRQEKLTAVLWENDRPNRVRLEEMTEDTEDPLLLEIEKQLREYFLQQRKAFDLRMEAYGTPFQRAVWELLNQIPYGVTCSYKDIALKLNHPKAVRAVGGAIGRNPISIITPCHRVIATNGSLTGFAGGLDRKQILLDLELHDSTG